MRRNVPECMADAPDEVIEAARVIARRAKDTLRLSVAAEFPGTDKDTIDDFTNGICQMMAGAQ
jgi:hypothetical protein